MKLCPASPTAHSEIYAAACNELLRRTPDLLFIKDLDLRYQGASLALAQLLGCAEPAGLLGKTDLELLADQELANSWRADELRLLSGNVCAAATSAMTGPEDRRRYAPADRICAAG